MKHVEGTYKPLLEVKVMLHCTPTHRKYEKHHQITSEDAKQLKANRAHCDHPRGFETMT